MSDGTRIVGQASVAGIRQMWEMTLPVGPVVLSVLTVPVVPSLESGMAPDRVQLLAAPLDDPHAPLLVADLDGRYLAAEIGAPFAGRVLGLYATTGTVTFRNYSYCGTEEG